MKLTTAAQIDSAFRARFPQSGKEVVSLNASAEPTTINSIQAAGVQGWAPLAGKVKTIKALIHFKVRGQDVFEGNLAEVPETDFLQLKHAGRAVEATEAEIAEANKPAKAK